MRQSINLQLTLICEVKSSEEIQVCRRVDPLDRRVDVPASGSEEEDAVVSLMPVSGSEGAGYVLHDAFGPLGPRYLLQRL